MDGDEFEERDPIRLGGCSDPASSPESPSPSTGRDPRVPCPHENSGGGRNLIVCIDGTANQFGEKVSFFEVFRVAHDSFTNVGIEHERHRALQPHPEGYSA